MYNDRYNCIVLTVWRIEVDIYSVYMCKCYFRMKLLPTSESTCTLYMYMYMYISV